MIDRNSIKIGTKVHYKPQHFNEYQYQNGIIKEIVNDNSVRVVYNCNNEWNNFMDYPSQLTNIKNLYLGWKHKND